MENKVTKNLASFIETSGRENVCVLGFLGVD